MFTAEFSVLIIIIAIAINYLAFSNILDNMNVDREVLVFAAGAWMMFALVAVYNIYIMSKGIVCT